MRNKVIEATIDQIVDQSPYSTDFKNAFKQYIKNRFDGNAADSDLKVVLNYIEITMEENDS